jgi:hypothetical protein
MPPRRTRATWFKIRAYAAVTPALAKGWNAELAPHDQESIQLKLRPFSRTDFGRFISWVSTSEALGQWCAAFFRHPLDEEQLQLWRMMTMAVATSTTPADESAMRSVAEAMRDAATTASEHAVKVKQSASEAGPKALETISRMVYTGSYVLAYGVVYATVFIAQSLPQENPVMHGFREGGQAAMDELGAV